MAEKESHQPTHKAFTVIKREGKEDCWLDIGVAFPHKDGRGFTVKLQAIPLDGKIVCREITADEEAGDPAPEPRPKPANAADRQGGTGRGRR